MPMVIKEESYNGVTVSLELEKLADGSSVKNVVIRFTEQAINDYKLPNGALRYEFAPITDEAEKLFDLMASSMTC